MGEVRVLIVPGEAAELAPVRGWVEARGGKSDLRLDRVASFDAAAPVLRRTAYQFVLCDLSANEEAGLDLLRDARAHGLSVPFLLLTSRSAQAVAARARTLGHAVCLPLRALSGRALERALQKGRGSSSADPHRAAASSAGAASTLRQELVSTAEAAPSDLAREVERLARANEDLEQLAYAAAHDLEQPLRTLDRSLESLAREAAGSQEPAAARHLDHARASARRMRTLVRDFLQCARAGIADQPLESIDLSAPLDWALANLRGLIEESGARVTRDPMPVALGDATQIARVFQNLIGNAIRFRGEAVPSVHVGAEEGEEVVLRVRDNGVGVDVGHHETIFEPFRKLRAAPPGENEWEPEGGSGIGLAICRRILDRHGGRIWVESEPGKGSTFSFTLRRASF